MLNNKRKIFLLFSLILVVIIGMSATTAADTTSNTTTISTETTHTSTTTNIEANNENIQTNNINKEIGKKDTENIKEARVITITNETYNKYFTNSSSYIPISNSINSGDTINLQGNFENVDFVVDKANVLFTSINNNVTLYNCTVYVQSQATGSTISNMNIYNTNKADAIGIYVNFTDNLIIENNHVVIDDCSYSFAFAGSLNNSVIRGNYFETLSTNTERTHTSFVIGRSFYNLITNNTIHSDEADGIYLSSYGSGRFQMAGQSSHNNITYNNVSGGNGQWVNLIQTTGKNNIIAYNNVTGGFQGIAALEGTSVIHDNNVSGPKQYGLYVDSNAIIYNNNISVLEKADAVKLFNNVLITNNNISSENGKGIYLQTPGVDGGSPCLNFTITSNKITSNNGTGIYTRGVANYIIIEDNIITTKQEGINFERQSANKKPNDILVNNNNITTQSDYAINFQNAGAQVASNINITVTDTNILTSNLGTGLHTSYLPPSNKPNITQVGTQIHLENQTIILGIQTNITATITTNDMSTINEGAVIFTDNKENQIGIAEIKNNQSTITTRFIDTQINQITATFNGTENYTTSQNTTNITIIEDFDRLKEMYHELFDENNNLKQALADNQTALAQATEENNQLKNNNTQLTEKIQEQENQINTLNTQLNNITNENNILQDKITQLNNQISIQNQTIKNLNEELINANKTITEQTQQIQQLNQIIQDQEDEISKLNEKLNESNITNTELANITEQLTTENNLLKSEINQLNELINTQNQSIINLNDELINYNKTITQKNTQIQELNNSMQALEKLIQDQNKTIQNLNNTLNNITKENNQLQKEITQQNNQINTLNNELKEAKALANQQNNTLQENNKIINQLNKLINELNNTINSLNKKIDELTSKQNVILTVNKIPQTKFSNNITITGNLTDSRGNKLKNQVITINFNNIETKTITNNKGTYSYNTRVSTVGTNNVTIKFEGTDKYNPNNKTTTFNVIKQGLKIKINNTKSVKYGSNVTITGKFMDENNRGIMNTLLKINLNGKTYTTKTLLGGIISFTTTTNKIETNNIIISYAGNKNYNSVQENATFTVTKQNLVITTDKITPVKYTDNVTITGTFTDANGKKIKNTLLTIKINSKTYTTKTDNNGIYTYTTQAKNMGTNNVTVTYKGNTKYNQITAKTTYQVNKQDTTISIDNIKYTNNNLTITGTFTDANKKVLKNTNIKLTINGKTVTTKTNSKGVYTYSTNTKKTTFNITTAYPGNTKYNNYSKTTILTL